MLKRISTGTVPVTNDDGNTSVTFTDERFNELTEEIWAGKLLTETSKFCSGIGSGKFANKMMDPKDFPLVQTRGGVTTGEGNSYENKNEAKFS